jgi:hypothetical protein
MKHSSDSIVCLQGAGCEVGEVERATRAPSNERLLKAIQDIYKLITALKTTFHVVTLRSRRGLTRE